MKNSIISICLSFLFIVVSQFICKATLNEELWRITANSKEITGIKFSHNGKLLVFTDNSFFKVIDLETDSIYTSKIPSNREFTMFGFDTSDNGVLFLVNNKIDSKNDINLLMRWDFINSTISQISKLDSTLWPKVSLTHDQKYIVGRVSLYRVFIWEANSGKLLNVLDSNSGYSAKSIAMSSKSNRFAASRDKFTYVYDIDSGKVLSSFKSGFGLNSANVFMQNDSMVCVYDNYGNIEVYDALTGNFIELKTFSSDMKEIEFIFNDSILVEHTYSYLRFYNWKTTKTIYSLLNNKSQINPYNICKNNGKYKLAFGGRSIFIYNLDTLQIIKKYFSINDNLEVNFSNDFKTLIGYKYSSARYFVFDAKNGDILKSDSLPVSNVKVYQYLPNQNLIVGAYLNEIYLIDASTNVVIEKYNFFDTITDIRFSNDLSYCSVVGKTNISYIFNWKSKKLMFFSEAPFGFYFSNSSKYVHSPEYNGSNMRTIVRETQTGDTVFQTRDMYSLGALITFDDENIFIIEQQPYRITAYSIKSGDSLYQIPFLKDWRSWPIIISPDNKYFIISTYSGFVNFYYLSPDSMKLAYSIGNYIYPVFSFAISDDYNFMSIVYDDGSICLFDIHGILNKPEEKSEVSSSLLIFPNPSYSGREITLQIPENISGIKISLYNSLGSLLDKHTESDVSPGQHTITYKPGVELSSGTYWLRVEAGGKSWCKPFLIIKN